MRSRAALGASLAIAVLSSVAPLRAQTVPFGKNKIQYNDFDWLVLSGPRVDVYYYPEEEQVAVHALDYAEQSYDVLERLFQHHPFRRIPLIVYSSDQHFEQTNLLPGFIPEGVLGFTEYLKRRVALPFRGDYDQFRKTLRHELVHAFQLSKLAEAQTLHPKHRGESPQFIHWWTEGLAEFWSGEQTAEDEMFVRDLVLNGRLPHLRQFNRTYSFFSYPLGAELHKYLTSRFGDGYIVRMYEEYRTYDSFELALEGVLGVDLDQLDRDWRYALEQRFFPEVAERAPPDVAARPVIHEGGANFKPTIWRMPSDSSLQLLFLSPRDGYTNVYATRLSEGENAVRTIVQGERSPEFESFHAYESGIDVSDDGVLAFVSKYLERDALVLWDLGRNEVVGRYQWDDLVGLKSPSWDPAGARVVFEGLSTAGFSDLYVIDFARNELRALTRDHYLDRDPDWSPDGSTIVFASDRSQFGEDGNTNLVAWDVAAGTMRFLTHGPWHDQQPRWAPDGDRLAFTSDRSGTYDLYDLKADGSGRRLTTMTGGAFDADWVPGGRQIVFTGFHNGTFSLYQADIPPDTLPAARIALGSAPQPPNGAPSNGASASAAAAGWQWENRRVAELTAAGPLPYAKWDRFTLDFAAADGIIAPGLGSAQGAQFLATDLLGDHILFGGISAVQVRGVSNLIDSFSGNLLYLNLKNRLNYGAGIFRFKGRFRDVALDVYDEETFGAYFLASYPFSRFKRVELQLGLERSHREDLEDAFEDGIFGTNTRPDPRDLTRTGILTTNYVSYVKDNTLWLPTGPIDGERYNLTVGLVSCFRCTTPSELSGEPVRRSAVGENFVLLADYRRYFRTSLYTAYAVRGFAFWSDGAIPGRAVLGGTWMLRGYPRFSLAGSRVWLINQEWRFPVLDGLSLAFPFGTLRLPGVQGAVFTDLGSSWLENQAGSGGAWGSYGLGFRSSLGPPLVLRLDIGRRFRTRAPPPVIFGGGEGFNDTFVDFFFGFNF
ncbi:MAG: hypothetical protein L0271_19055 [Gemmatimonadetes bacterium]|nr:hypothetical protein [Gemmatimonadota bacterium]